MLNDGTYLVFGKVLSSIICSRSKVQVIILMLYDQLVNPNVILERDDVTFDSSKFNNVSILLNYKGPKI